MKRLPDAEFDIMKVIWDNEPPITTSLIMQQLGNSKEWKAQTIISLMLRLVERGFVRTEKNGKIRNYFPLISEEEYLNFEAKGFMKRFHFNSFTSMVSQLYDGTKIKSEDLDELEKWLKEKKE
ncbi:BlaI/MecI/CopY family transcriptional regulator [Saccharibacillus sacchari]|uniref:BlaI/MecI/CopY family transcriptional regulator n=1 Tax=Saccharibacillus sacchari TaxID=456493 RepID=A0ACC6PIY5_9BACL